jgi:hypothetical protein
MTRGVDFLLPENAQCIAMAFLGAIVFLSPRRRPGSNLAMQNLDPGLRRGDKISLPQVYR